MKTPRTPMAPKKTLTTLDALVAVAFPDTYPAHWPPATRALVDAAGCTSCVAAAALCIVCDCHKQKKQAASELRQLSCA